MLEILEYMSIWELAHRWEDADPMTPPNTPIPLNVQPILRALSYSVATGTLWATRPIFFGPADATDDDEFTEVVFESSHNTGPNSAEILTLLTGEFDRKLLSELFISTASAFYWAIKRDDPISVPDFIIPQFARVKTATGSSVAKPSKTKPNRRPEGELFDKATCQGAAKAIWRFLPDLPIAQVCEHPAFLEAGGRNYQAAARRRWAKEVAPPTLSREPGRRRELSLATPPSSE